MAGVGVGEGSRRGRYGEPMPDYPYAEFKWGVSARQGGDPFELMAMFKTRSNADAFLRMKESSSDPGDGWSFKVVPT